MSLPRSLLLASLIALPAVATRGWADDQKDIADLEKKIAELQGKLGELKKSETTTPVKKALTLNESDTWKSIRGIVLSGDGKYLAHRVAPGEGNGEVILRTVADGKETKFAGGSGFGQLVFSHDSKWLAFSVTPHQRPSFIPSMPRAKAKVVVINTASGEKTEIEGAASFDFSGETSSHLVYRKATAETTTAPAGLSGPPTRRGGPALEGPPAPSESQTGSDLVIRDLASGVEMALGNVIEYSFDKKGDWLVALIEATGQIGNGVQLRDMKTGAIYPVESDKASYRGLAWNENTTAFTVRKSIDDTGYESKWISIVGFSNLGPKPKVEKYDPKGDKAFPTGMAISANRPATWTDDLGGFIFGIAERRKKEEGSRPTASAPSKDADKKDAPSKESTSASSRPSASSSSKPELVIWHWKDERLQPMQQVQAAMDRQHTFTAIYHIKDKKFVRLGDDTVRTVTASPKHRYALGRDTKPYEYMSNLDGRRYSDVYVIDTTTGEKKKVLTKARYVFTQSPTGTHFLYYEDGNYFTYDMTAGKAVNITEKVSAASFVDSDDDHNVDKPPRGSLGWSRDGKSVILSDGFDLWAVKADGSGGENLTVNGRTEGIRYQGMTQYEHDPKPGIDLTKPVYVTLYGEYTKKGGIGRIDAGKPGVTRLVWGDCLYGTPLKARSAEVFALSKQTAIDYPDYYLTDASFKELKKVTDANPQQKDYLWTSGVKIVEYSGTAGKKLQGTLYLPANYEPGKKYPTVVYIYEKLTQGTHQYQPPSYRGGFNRSIYTSNGYAVYTPDIAYRVNDPGKSSVECILPAIDAAVGSTVVDPAKVALHGHSWGGYQTAFAVTQTNKFKCAIAGAPLTDLISMYSSVYWNSGSANQPIFESSQGRFTAGYWDEQDAYIRNSPVYFAKNVQTPLVILHNDKDGAVDFTQGIEYYNTLRRLQKPVVMLQYKGENHGLAKTENQKDYAVRMREFFDHYLMGKPAPDWWKDGVPHLKMDEHLKNRK